MRSRYVMLWVTLMGVAWAPAASAQSSAPSRPAASAAAPLALSLEEAVARAVEQSQEVRLARAQLERAQAQVKSARSAALPQVNASLSYTRTFESPFSGGGSMELPDSLRFDPDPSLPLEERVAYLEDRAPMAGLGGLGQLFGNLPFGREHSYVASVTGTQMVYAGGRVGAALKIANHYEEAARLNVEEQIAEIELKVRTAYHRALLAKKLEEISQAAVDQAEAFLEEERLRQRAGNASDLDVMRAEVAAENLRPQLVQARNASELALLDLKRLIDLPLTQPVELTTELEIPAPDVLAADVADAGKAATQRAAVRAAEEQVRMREQQVRIAKGAYLPTVSVHMTYGKQLFPSKAFDFSGDPRTDWNAGVSVQIPIFQGFKRVADVDDARAQLEEARLQLAQLQEAVELQYEQAKGERERARAEIAARQRTVEQAERVYELTELRYGRGLATQLEVSDARLALLQARTNLAQALADFYIADASLVRALGGSSVAGRMRSAPAGGARPAPPEESRRAGAGQGDVELNLEPGAEAASGSDA